MVITLLVVLVLAYVALCAVLFIFQRSLIYFPQPRMTGSGTNLLTLPVDDERVLVSTKPVESPKAVIYFGGNAEDVSLTVPELSAAFPEHALYLMHYRGYGGSTGSPSEEALLSDALVLYDQVSAGHQDFVVVGRSLGSAVAVYVASRRPVARLVLITPFDSLQGLAARQFLFVPVQWLLLDKYETWRWAPDVTAPTTIIVAEHDEIIPRESSEKLLSRFRDGVASLTVVSGTTHNNIPFSTE